MRFRSRLAFAVLTCLAATLAGGCSRSSDGSVIIPKHMDSRRFWQDDEARRAASEEALKARYPDGGQQIRFVDQQPMPARRSPASRRTADTVASSDKPLSCRAVTGENGRVRYYCG